MKYLYICSIIFIAGCATTPKNEDSGVKYIDKRFERIQKSDDITPHRITKSSKQKYPEQLRMRGVEGVVVLVHDINRKGEVENARILFSRPSGVFDQGTLAAANEWRFEPALKNGEPVAVRNVVMQTVFCAPKAQRYENREPICNNKRAMEELMNSIEIPKKVYES